MSHSIGLGHGNQGILIHYFVPYLLFLRKIDAHGAVCRKRFGCSRIRKDRIEFIRSLGDKALDDSLSA